MSRKRKTLPSTKEQTTFFSQHSRVETPSEIEQKSEETSDPPKDINMPTTGVPGRVTINDDGSRVYEVPGKKKGKKPHTRGGYESVDKHGKSRYGNGKILGDSEEQ